MEEGNGIMRPNRSDVHVSKEEEAKIEEATREYFDGITPKRHTKPQRSDYSSTYTHHIPSNDYTNIPELLQFQRLQNDPQAACFDASIIGRFHCSNNSLTYTSQGDNFTVVTRLSFEKGSPKLVYSGNSQVTEEFVETEYYKDLNCIDKQHHTTGTGFIKVENANGNTFDIGADSATTDSGHAYKGNPATNDWIPSAVDAVNFISDKPTRSDN